MKIFAQDIEEGYFSLTTNNVYIKYKIEKIRYGYKVTGKIKGKLGKIKVLEIDKPKQKLYINNWQSWGPFLNEKEFNNIRNTETLRKIGILTYTPIPEFFTKYTISDYFITSKGLLMGFLTSKIGHPFFTITNDSIEGYIEYFNEVFEEYIPIEPFVILKDPHMERLLLRYSDLAKIENNIKIKFDNPVGWSSWYQYFLNFAWTDIVDNLKKAKKMKMPYDVFQIDDGYESDIGDWLLTKDGFPDIYEMAKIIKTYGFTPGIWIAPLSVSHTSKLFKEHKDWLIKEDGAPKKIYHNWERDIYALDITNDSVKNWLYNTFFTFKKAGFEYFKIDFMFAGATPGQRTKNITPIQAYREALSIIRKAVENSFILGCGAPLLSSAGFVDGMRVGPDTAPYWNKTCEPGSVDAYWALKISIMRWFMHDKWWISDPDCILLRDQDTKLTPSQRELYGIVSGILDNMIIQSDKLLYIKDKEKKLFKKILSLQNGRPYVEIVEDEVFIIKTEGSNSGNIKIIVNIGENSFFLNNQEVLPCSYKIIETDTTGKNLFKKSIKRENKRIFTYYEGKN